MDLGGHERFRTSEPRVPGLSLLANGWAALASAHVERVDIHLRSGQLVAGALDLRIDGAVAEASTVQGQWTHVFAVADVVLVRKVPRGG
ncbi:hypothetical protein [Sandaracinobacteroides hominis]|uniref:hypothetical protein n=1 Tax=Sandaracinobacteroides hominis TaxID=2780086 RepID=UPI0018F49F4B|nr:hypothetical protein [Sandaracinobacteroides hominis]